MCVSTCPRISGGRHVFFLRVCRPRWRAGPALPLTSHASRVPCEVLDPGAWLRPAEPPLWSDDDALSDLKTPALDTLEDIDPLSRERRSGLSRCHRHHMPHLRSMELLGHSRTPLGMLPRYTLHLLVEYVPPPPPVVHVETPRPLWKLAESIYAPRIKEADSHGFYNPEKVHARMLAQDLRILEEQPRWPKFINRLAGSITRWFRYGGHCRSYKTRDAAHVSPTVAVHGVLWV